VTSLCTELLTRESKFVESLWKWFLVANSANSAIFRSEDVKGQGHKITTDSRNLEILRKALHIVSAVGTTRRSVDFFTLQTVDDSGSSNVR